MAHTKNPLTYEREASGENWHVATVEFGLMATETFFITTDHVHASEVDYGEPEDDVRLWCAARELLTALTDLIALGQYVQTPRGDIRNRYASAEQRAREAIAKARGTA